MKQLKRMELQKAMKFQCSFEHITSKLENGRLVRVISDGKTVNKRMSILEAMALYRESLHQPWEADFFKAQCANCTIYIDGCKSENGKTWVGAYLTFPKAKDNAHFEFIIATLGDATILEDEYEGLSNLNYIEEGKILKLDSDFKIRVK